MYLSSITYSPYITGTLFKHSAGIGILGIDGYLVVPFTWNALVCFAVNSEHSYSEERADEFVFSDPRQLNSVFRRCPLL